VAIFSFLRPAVQQERPPIPGQAGSHSGDPECPVLELPTLSEWDAYYRNPSSLAPDRFALVEEFARRQCVPSRSREKYLQRRNKIKAAISAEANR
jgi:hypothetical protein